MLLVLALVGLALAEDDGGARSKVLMQSSMGKVLPTADLERHSLSEPFPETLEEADSGFLLEEEDEDFADATAKDASKEGGDQVARIMVTILVACVTILSFTMRARDHLGSDAMEETNETKMDVSLDPYTKERSSPVIDDFGSTALHRVAAEGGNVQKLLAAGADAHAQDAWDETALHMAARQGCVENCVALLEAGVALDAFNADDETALLVAARAGNTACCAELLERGASLGGLADEALPPCLAALFLERLLPKVGEDVHEHSVA